MYCETWSGRPASIPALDVSATTDEAAKTLWLSVVNRDKNAAHKVELRLRSSQFADTARRCELSAPSPLSMNTVAEPELVSPSWSSIELTDTPVVSVPACSYTILEIPLG
jgi:alpha-L-arabinofuranosidase